MNHNMLDKLEAKARLILPVLDGHPVKRVHSLTEVANSKGSKLGYITQTSEISFPC